MSPFSVVLAAKLRMARHALASVRRESKLKVALVGTSVVLLWLAVFGLAMAGFAALDRFGRDLLGTPDLSLVELLLPRVLSVFAMVLFVLLLFSNALLTHATLYRSREVHLLLVSPLSFREVFLARFAEIVTFSSWSTAYLASPVVLALGLVRRAGWSYYVEVVLLFVPFVVIPAALGAMVAVLVARVAHRLPRLTLAGAVLVIVTPVFLLFRAQLADPHFRDAVDLGPALRLTAGTDNPFLPSSWLSGGVVSALAGSSGQAAYAFLLLLANAVFLTWLAAEAAQRLFHPGWTGLAAARRKKRRRAGGTGSGGLAWLLSPLPEQARWLTVKDICLFARDPGQWSQFALFFGMLLLYVANMRSGPRGFSTSFWQGWITLLNTVAALLVLATLTTRFVFPLVSLEGHRFWILGQAPLARRTLVAQKFWLSVAVSGAITVALALISGWRLGLPAAPFAFSVFAVASASVALSGIAVGLGSLYPNFAEESPSRIVSGLGGTLTFILSSVYVVLVAAAETAVFRWGHAGHRPWDGGPGAIGVGTLFVLALTAVATLVPLRLGARNLERLEV